MARDLDSRLRMDRYEGRFTRSAHICGLVDIREDIGSESGCDVIAFIRDPKLVVE